jgi:hypothetical protein
MSRILSDLENEDKKLNRAFTDGILEGIRNNIRWAEKYLEQVYLVIESRIMIGRMTNSLAKTLGHSLSCFAACPDFSIFFYFHSFYRLLNKYGNIRGLLCIFN